MVEQTNEGYVVEFKTPSSVDPGLLYWCRDLIKSRLKNCGYTPKFSIKQDARQLIVIGVPKDILESRIIGKQKFITEFTEIASSNEAEGAEESTPEQITEQYDATIQGLLEQQEQKDELLMRKDKNIANLQGRIADLEGRLKLANTERPQTVLEPKPIETIVRNVLPQETIANIMMEVAKAVALCDERLIPLGEMSADEALKFMNYSESKFFSDRLGARIDNLLDIVGWLSRQNHRACYNSQKDRRKHVCLHKIKVDSLLEQYKTLKHIKRDLLKHNEKVGNILYCLAEQDGNSFVYLPVGRSKGWLTKSLQQHVWQTASKNYANIKSERLVSAENVRKITVPGVRASVLKDRLEKSQNNYDFYKFNYRVKVVAC